MTAFEVSYTMVGMSTIESAPVSGFSAGLCSEMKALHIYNEDCLSEDRRLIKIKHSLAGQRMPFLPPIADTAVHRDHIRITHLLQIVSREC